MKLRVLDAMRWRVLFGLLAVITLAVAGLGWKWSTLAAARSKVLKLPGVVEIQEVRLASKQGGKGSGVAPLRGARTSGQTGPA